MDRVERHVGRPRQHPLLTLLALSALVLIVAASIWSLAGQAPLQASRLPDGTVLRLEAITHGPQHHFVLGRKWLRLMARVLPPGALGRFGATICDYGPTDPAAVVFWTTWDANSPLTDWSRTVALNESGEEVEVIARPFQTWLQTTANAKLRGWIVPAFPRRGSTIRLRIWVHGQKSPVAEFRVPNPDPPPHPTWTAAALPVTQRDGDREWTLTRLETGAVAPIAPPSPFRDRHWTRVLLRVRERGRPTDWWEPVSVSLSDATGNRVTPWPLFSRSQGGEIRLAFCGNLPPSETAWKLRAEFAPARGFAQSDLWRVSGVPIPGPSVPIPGSRGPIQFAAENRKRGVRMQLSLSQEGGGPGFIYLRLKLKAVHRKGEHVALVAAINDRGRENRIEGWPTPGFPLSADDVPGIRLEIIRPIMRTVENPSWLEGGVYLLRSPNGAKTLSLTFAFVRSRFVEFLARPTERQNGPGS